MAVAGRPLDQLLKLRKYAFVCFTSIQEPLRRSDWYIIDIGRWAYVRYRIESFGLHAVQHAAIDPTRKLNFGCPNTNDMIRGFVLYAMPETVVHPSINEEIESLMKTGPSTVSGYTELQGTSWVTPNSFITIQRWPMPWGARAYVPMEETEQYVLLEHQATTGMDDDIRQKAQADLDSYKRQHSRDFHAADRPIKRFTHKYSNGSTNYMYYTEAPKEYNCHGCQKRGHHYLDACFLFQKRVHEDQSMEEEQSTTKALFQQWGPQKFQKT